MENFLPGWSEGFVFSVGHDTIIAELNNTKWVRFSTNICRCQSLGLDDFNHQVSNIFHFIQSVGWILYIWKKVYITIITFWIWKDMNFWHIFQSKLLSSFPDLLPNWRDLMVNHPFRQMKKIVLMMLKKIMIKVTRNKKTDCRFQTEQAVYYCYQIHLGQSLITWSKYIVTL